MSMIIKKLILLIMVISFIGCSDVSEFMSQDEHPVAVVDLCLDCHRTQPPYTPGEIPGMDSIPGYYE